MMMSVHNKNKLSSSKALLKSKKHIIFDFDGPIVDLFESHRSEHNVKHLNVHSKPIGECINYTKQGANLFKEWSDTRRLSGNDSNKKKNIDRYYHFLLEKIEMEAGNASQIDENALNIIQHSYKKFGKISILSNNSEKIIKSLLKKNNIIELFSYISGRTDENPYTLLKPNPLRLIKLIELSKCSTSSTLYIGDTRADFECSKRANVDFIGIKTRHSPDIGASKSLDNVFIIEDRCQLADLFL